jgi:hypothetical protein
LIIKANIAATNKITTIPAFAICPFLFFIGSTSPPVDFLFLPSAQHHLDRIVASSSLGKVVSTAIGCYYDVLVAEGSVPP